MNAARTWSWSECGRDGCEADVNCDNWVEIWIAGDWVLGLMADIDDVKFGKLGNEWFFWHSRDTWDRNNGLRRDGNIWEGIHRGEILLDQCGWICQWLLDFPIFDTVLLANVTRVIWSEFNASEADTMQSKIGSNASTQVSFSCVSLNCFNTPVIGFWRDRILVADGDKRMNPPHLSSTATSSSLLFVVCSTYVIPRMSNAIAQNWSADSTFAFASSEVVCTGS